MSTEVWTHKAWFYLCPVLMTLGDYPNVKARWTVLEYWFDFNEVVVQALGLPFVFRHVKPINGSPQ